MKPIKWKPTLDTLNDLLAAAPMQRCLVLAPVAAALKTTGETYDRFIAANADELRAEFNKFDASRAAFERHHANWSEQLAAESGPWEEAERAVRYLERHAKPAAPRASKPAVLDAEALHALEKRARAAMEHADVSDLERGWVKEFLARLDAEFNNRPRAPNPRDLPQVAQLHEVHVERLSQAVHDAEAAIAFLKAR